MQGGVHARLMVTRGVKRTPSQDPRQAVGLATIVIIAEHKLPNPALATTGLALMTSTYRLTRPDQFDMRLNTHSRLPLILALMQAYNSGADEALMLDDRGFVASCRKSIDATPHDLPIKMCSVLRCQTVRSLRGNMEGTTQMGPCP